MNPATLLNLAADLLREVLRLQAPADTVVAAWCRQHPRLGPRERHLLAEVVYAVLRRLPLLRHLAAGGPVEAGPPPLPRTPGKGRGPQPVSIDRTERRLALLAWPGETAPLRGSLSPAELDWLDAVRQIDPMTCAAALRHQLPEWLAEALQPLGADFWPLAEALLTPAPLDVRVNLLKTKPAAVRLALAQQGIEAQPTPYAPAGLRLVGKPALTRLAVYTQGGFEVQDEGSQLLAALVDARRGERVVDFCAGAGGKTLALGAAMRNQGQLYAFDTAAHRIEALKPRLQRAGLSIVHTMALAHERDERLSRLLGKVDRVLVDAPCSGLGTLRRNPDLKWRQSPVSVQALEARQHAILAAAARLLAPGGRLVYATCSVLAQENEQVARAFDAGHGRDFERLDVAPLLAAAQVPQAQTLVEDGDLRLWPHRHQTDGFYAAVWRRR